MDRGFDPADMAQDLNICEMPPGSDRRAFMMRSALAISIASLTGRPDRRDRARSPPRRRRSIPSSMWSRNPRDR